MEKPAVVHSIQRVSHELVEQFASRSSATVHEASGGKGALSPRLKPIDPGMRICGTAITVKLRPGDNLMLHKAIYVAKAGDVIVADANGYIDAGGWGEVMGVAAQARGIAGLVFNGAVRDTRELTELGFPVFAAGVCIRGAEKVSLGPINHPLVLDGVVINPGDLVLGDRDGVVIVEREMAAEVLEKARAREQKEAHMMQRLRSGETTLEMFGLDKVLKERGLTEEEH